MTEKICPECNGEGVVDQGTEDETRCPTCNGSGVVPDDGQGSEEVWNTHPERTMTASRTGRAMRTAHILFLAVHASARRPASVILTRVTSTGLPAVKVRSSVAVASLSRTKPTIMSRVKRVCYAVPDPKMGCLGGATNLNDLPRVNHHVELTAGGVLETECRELLQTFFKLKRAEES